MVSTTGVGVLVARPVAVSEVHPAGDQQRVRSGIRSYHSASIAGAPRGARGVCALPALAAKSDCTRNQWDQLILCSVSHDHLV